MTITKTKKRETVGAASLKALKDYNPDQTVIETQQAMLKDGPDELVKCAKEHEKYFGNDKPYYLIVVTKREKLLQNVVRQYYFARRTRPIPDYDTALYYYEPKDEKITFVWVIPCQEAVDHFTGYYYVDDAGALHWIPPAKPKPDEEQLAWFCKCFKENTLV